MRVLLLAQTLPVSPYRDGATLRVHHLFRAFARRGGCHLVAFADEPDGGDRLDDVPEGGSYRAVPLERARGPLALARKALSSRRFWSQAMADALRQGIDATDPHVIVAEQTFMGQYAGAMEGVPRVMSAVDAISLAALRHAEMDDTPWTGKLAWRYVARQRLAVERRWYPAFDAVTCVAEEDAAWLRARVGVPVQVIPNGVDGQHFTPALRAPEPRTVLFSGNLDAPMNEEAALFLLRQVYPEVRRRFPHLTYAIAGRNPTARILREAPPWLELRADVPDMRDALADVALFVCPVAYGSGIKNNVLQAMAMGIPVACTPLIAEPIGIRDRETGFVAPRATFADAVAAALGDAGALAGAAARGRTRVEERFTWDGVADQYLGLFRRVAGGGAGGRA